MKRKFLEVINVIQDCGAVEDNQLVLKCCSNEALAELLVQNNGVILPARIGQKVWGIFTPCGGCKDADGDERCLNCEKATVEKIDFDWDLVPSWGKDVFATKEEAEAELEKRKTVKRITVIICEPGKLPRIDHIENTLEAMQEIVGGYIETVTFAEDACIVCNEEGRLKGLAPCMKLFGIDFVGTCMVVGVKGEEFCSVPENAYNLLFRRNEHENTEDN